MPGDPKECRENAKCCLQMAADSTSPLARAQFEKIAQKWLLLAADLEHAKTIVEQWGVIDERKKAG